MRFITKAMCSLFPNLKRAYTEEIALVNQAKNPLVGVSCTCGFTFPW
jgi:hypothetical protein